VAPRYTLSSTRISPVCWRTSSTCVQTGSSTSVGLASAGEHTQQYNFNSDDREDGRRLVSRYTDSFPTLTLQSAKVITVPHRIICSWYTGRYRWAAALHLVQQKEAWAGCGPAQSPRCTNVTAHSSTASVPISVFLYSGPLLCGFNVPIKGSTF